MMIVSFQKKKKIYINIHNIEFCMENNFLNFFFQFSKKNTDDYNDDQRQLS